MDLLFLKMAVKIYLCIIQKLSQMVNFPLCLMGNLLSLKWAKVQKVLAQLTSKRSKNKRDPLDKWRRAI